MLEEWKVPTATCRQGCVGLVLLSGCAGAQSALDPAGEAAQRISTLFWQMTAGSLAIWLAVLGIAVYAIYRSPRPEDTRYGHWLIVGGGVVAPTLVLAGLLVYGLAMLPPLLAAAPEGSMQVRVSGEQYWWRVRYTGTRGQPVELANELHMPVDAYTDFELTSPDVIHSFWIPSLGGKIDMIPGRTTRLALRPTKTGVLSGACAEYCGTSHAHMGLRVIVQPAAELAAWLAREQLPAHTPSDPLAQQGAKSFAAQGCGACHTVRGTSARGVVGPDLTHVGSRLTVGAGVLPNGAPQLERWLQQIDAIKPGTSMPHFGMLPVAERQALAAYLEALQ